MNPPTKFGFPNKASACKCSGCCCCSWPNGNFPAATIPNPSYPNRLYPVTTQLMGWPSSEGLNTNLPYWPDAYVQATYQPSHKEVVKTGVGIAPGGVRENYSTISLRGSLKTPYYGEPRCLLEGVN